jgi:F0F1-type ATP synthase assembly protein I
VKAKRTAAIVVRKRLAAERSSWVVGVVVGWVVDRLAVCWPVLWDVVVAVDMTGSRECHVCG